MSEIQNLQNLLAAIINEEILCSDEIQEQLKKLREVDFTLSFKNGKFTVSNPIVKAKPFNFYKHDIDLYVAGSYNPQNNKIGIAYILDDGENTLEYSDYTTLNNQQILPEAIGEIYAVINAINLLIEEGINTNQNIKLFFEHTETDPWNYEKSDLKNKFIYDYSDFMKFQEKSISIIYWENTSNLADQKLTKEAKNLQKRLHIILSSNFQIAVVYYQIYYSFLIIPDSSHPRQRCKQHLHLSLRCDKHNIKNK